MDQSPRVGDFERKGNNGSRSYNVKKALGLAGPAPERFNPLLDSSRRVDTPGLASTPQQNRTRPCL